MNDTVLSCGLIITSPDGWLLAHATNSVRWDIPKGRQETGEHPLTTAVRECWEETNIDVTPWRHLIVDLGRHAYLRHKDLHVFRLDLPHALDLSGCCCHTHVEIGARRFLETDQWAWVPVEAVHTHVGKGLHAVLRSLRLLP